MAIHGKSAEEGTAASFAPSSAAGYASRTAIGKWKRRVSCK